MGFSLVVRRGKRFKSSMTRIDMISSNCRLVCRLRVEVGDLTGVAADDLVEYYLGSWAQNTLAIYKVALGRVLDFGEKIKKSVFLWGQGEVAGLLVELGKGGATENMVKQGMAVVNICFEAMGKESPTKESLVARVKKTALKRRGVTKKVERKTMKLEDLEQMVEFGFGGAEDEAGVTEKRCVVLQMLLFLGVKRFSDISKVKVQDVGFREDGSIVVAVGKTKTDQQGKGGKFFIGGKIKKRFSVSSIVRKYIRNLKLSRGSFLFPQLRWQGREVVVKEGRSVSFSAAYDDLKRVSEKLALGKLTLHSGRIGGATAGIEAGVNKEYLRLCGGWTSEAINDYIRPEEPGMVFSKAVLSK